MVCTLVSGPADNSKWLSVSVLPDHLQCFSVGLHHWPPARTPEGFHRLPTRLKRASAFATELRLGPREGLCPSPVPQVAPRTPWLFSVWSSCFLLYSWFSCNFIYLLFLYFSLSYLCLPFVSLSCLAPVCFCVWVCTFSSLSVTHRHLFLFLEGRGECKFLMWYQKQIHFNYFQCVLDECSINTGTYLVNATIGV